MRRCSKCNKDLPESEFYKKGKNGKLHSYCKSYLYEYQMARWIGRKKKAIDERGGCCSICGYNKNYACLVFHHTDPNEKEFEWEKLRMKSWDKINKELDKCIILCANCHGEEHYPELNKG